MSDAHDGETQIRYDVLDRLLQAPKGSPVRAVRDATIYFLASLIMGPHTAPPEWYSKTVRAFEDELQMLTARDHTEQLEPWFKYRQDEAQWALELLRHSPIQLAINYKKSGGHLTFTSRDAVRKQC